MYPPYNASKLLIHYHLTLPRRDAHQIHRDRIVSFCPIDAVGIFEEEEDEHLLQNQQEHKFVMNIRRIVRVTKKKDYNSDLGFYLRTLYDVSFSRGEDGGLIVERTGEATQSSYVLYGFHHRAHCYTVDEGLVLRDDVAARSRLVCAASYD